LSIITVVWSIEMDCAGSRRRRRPSYRINATSGEAGQVVAAWEPTQDGLAALHGADESQPAARVLPLKACLHAATKTISVMRGCHTRRRLLRSISALLCHIALADGDTISV